MIDTCRVVVRGECKGLRDMRTGETFTDFLPLARPAMKSDATTIIDEPYEYSFPVKMEPCSLRFFELIK